VGDFAIASESGPVRLPGLHCLAPHYHGQGRHLALDGCQRIGTLPGKRYQATGKYPHALLTVRPGDLHVIGVASVMTTFSASLKPELYSTARGPRDCELPPSVIGVAR